MHTLQAHRRWSLRRQRGHKVTINAGWQRGYTRLWGVGDQQSSHLYYFRHGPEVGDGVEWRHYGAQ
ncbi:hypothetical protein BD779DRAFT_1506608 [Infundibulicybe gibba]|nr:hypothetical protein BD779DRAFT_1524192 [Infundibulicybe gibba]KAF8893502.1 hypothetical protein BD779DRAFT_1506608 [Infundibulicybe gibba]